MYTIRYRAHNGSFHCEAVASDEESAVELVCALRYTGFSFTVTACGLDLTADFLLAVKARAEQGRLPVALVASADTRPSLGTLQTDTGRNVEVCALPDGTLAIVSGLPS